MNSRNVKMNEKLVYKNDFKHELINKPEKQIMSLSESDSDTNEKQTENLIDEQQPEYNENDIITQNPEPKKRGRKRKAENQKQPEEPAERIRIQPKRKPKEGRDFTIYAKTADLNNPIEDSSFAFFTPDTLDKSKVIFRDPITEINLKDDLEEDEMKFAFMATLNKDPSSYEEAMASSEQKFWQCAVEEELNSMYKNEVWKIVDKPTSRKEENKLNIIDSKWVFKKKTGKDGKTTYKARLVIRGFKDRKEYELRETYAPVSRMALIRTFLAIVNKYDLELVQMDVKTAFLNGILEEKVFMKIPLGVEISKEERNRKLCEVGKALYGLRISPKK